MTTGTDAAIAALLAQLSDHDVLLEMPADQQVQIQIQSDTRLDDVCWHLAEAQYYLVTVVANDERELEDRRYKIYYVFSHPCADLFVILEYLLGPDTVSYRSIRTDFPAAEPFEREICDMLGLICDTAGSQAGPAAVLPGSWLHEAYPAGLFPLRRTETAAQLRARAEHDRAAETSAAPVFAKANVPPPSEPGAMTFPVGPIHAGIIESGQFWITTSGEVIENLQLRLGFAHRGIERMFQSSVNLIDGWQLAEQVSGDTSFAHSLAYCRAAEMLTATEVPAAARLLRGLFTELERIHNHVADLSGMAEDVGMEQFAAEFAVIREEVLRLNKRLTGHRYLRSVNQVGGVHLTGPLDLADVASVITAQLSAFEDLAATMTSRGGFRERTIRVGILTAGEALALGATGLAARASGVPRDSRLRHPLGVHRDVQHILRAGQALGDDREACAGDVFARTLVRAREVLVSGRLIRWVAGQWSELMAEDRRKLCSEPRVQPKNNYTTAIGHAEGCRGDVVYWLMQDKMNGIYRCKVRDPSMLNWPALRVCALPKTVEGIRRETLVADFPLLNKSFSLSYAGNDL